MRDIDKIGSILTLVLEYSGMSLEEQKNIYDKTLSNLAETDEENESYLVWLIKKIVNDEAQNFKVVPTDEDWANLWGDPHTDDDLLKLWSDILKPWEEEFDSTTVTPDPETELFKATRNYIVNHFGYEDFNEFNEAIGGELDQIVSSVYDCGYAISLEKLWEEHK